MGDSGLTDLPFAPHPQPMARLPCPATEFALHWQDCALYLCGVSLSSVGFIAQQSLLHRGIDLIAKSLWLVHVTRHTLPTVMTSLDYIKAKKKIKNLHNDRMSDEFIC